MYEKNNSYNSPAAQMQRLKDAGLNPDLMYSRGDVGNATAPEAPAQAPTPRFNVIPTNTYGQTAQIAAEIFLPGSPLDCTPITPATRPANVLTILVAGTSNCAGSIVVIAPATLTLR